MLLKIIETTDGKNRGRVLEAGQLSYVLDGDYVFEVTGSRVKKDGALLFNANYIVRCVPCH